ncbi:SAP domain-containing protein [uncultured Methanobrevibacter sp.]|uniref:SAP domain-containing protein n=1 Tax=uncultured Methanobrevibacter sp. TaxID=253161 RepID=UPI0025F2F0F4|nr:SAP domain-containing protein [uncultured Methanobrevibacter sp.]
MSEQKLEVFNVLNFLSRGYKIDDILNEDNFGTFQSGQDCLDYLVEEGYLSGNGGTVTAEEISKKYTVADLKVLLKENGLKVSGKKQELVERILPVLNEGAGAGDYELTDKAHEFLKENDWIDLYMFALVAFRFEDYKDYVEGSSADKIETALNFCDEILSRALIANQFIVFIDALSAKAHVYAYDGDYNSFMDYDLQRYILGLNPISLDAQTYATYDPINDANIYNLRRVLEKLDMGSLKKRFDKIWNICNIRNTTVPKKTCYKILQRALDGADLEELNFDIKEKYFNKKFGI